MPKRNLKKLHVAEIYSLVQSGDSEAMDHFIESQQQGRSLRFYPDGRQDIDDDGVVAVQITSRAGLVHIRSGRPRKMVMIDKDTAIEWILGLPYLVETADNWRLERGMSKEECEELELYNCTTKFSHTIYYNDDADDPIELEFSPPGHDTWTLRKLDSARLVRSLSIAGASKGWSYNTPEVTKEQEARVLKMLNIAKDNE